MKTLIKKILLISMVAAASTTSQPILAALQEDAAGQQKAQIRKIQDYLNGIRTLRANITQENPNGTTATGRMYLKRLGKQSFGKLRLEYDAPMNTKIIANGEILRHIDGETKDVSEYSIDSTPASFLLRHKIDFSNDLEVKKMETKGDKIYLTVVRPGDDGVTLTLIFVTTPILRLQEWTVVDAQANQTHVVLKQVEIGTAIDEKLFTF
ncbi:MAG: outer membrane lipoprotein carrier protein LolA [Alphaproteobacteria bacterium]|jgi:outer membrane lipoprotein-sorting protein|nr:outer membrane lipoprotein carrier protein LolA [Alphaproteobacteria bacterium]